MDIEQNPDEPLRATRTVSADVTVGDAETARRLKADAFMKRVRSRFRLAADGEELQRKRSLEEVDFNSGNHWDREMRTERESQDRVCIEVNRTPQYLNQVANEERMTRPQILVRPVGGKADVDTAEVKQGIIRSVECRSGAEGIRDDAFYRMLEKGWAYYRVMEQWENERSWKRIFKTVPIYDDFSVYCDPAAREYDRSDAEFYFITDDVPEDEYYGDMDANQIAAKQSDFEGLGDNKRYWIGDKTVRVAEFYYKVRETMLLFVLPGNVGVFEDEVTADNKPLLLKKLNGELISRMSSRVSIYWAKVDGTGVIDGNEDKTAGRKVIGKFIPIIPVLGRRIRVENKYIYTGMVRDAIEPCLAADYWLSAITEMVALAPKAPWVAAYKAIARYENMWTTSNTENWAALYYDHIDEAGNVLPPPQRSFANVDINAMTFILRYADEDLKKVMGIYNAGLGAPGPETSGVAIGARQRESDTANFNYIDNLKRSIAYEAQNYLSLIPEILDEAQVVQIVRPDGEAEDKTINAMFPGPDGKPKQYDMKDENYDVVVEVGASFNTKREAAAAGMMEFLKIDPTAAPIVGDLIADNQDYPNKEEFKNRLKRRVPPEILGDDDKDNKVEIPPKFKAQYDQQAQMLEQLTQQFQALQHKLETDEIKFEHDKVIKAMELASLERRAALSAEVEALKVASKEDLEQLKIAQADLARDLEQFKQPGPVEYDFDHETQQLVPGQGGMPLPGQTPQQVQA